MVARGYETRFRRALLQTDRRASAAMAFPKATPLPLPGWSMFRPGSNAIIRRCSPAPCSIRQPMGFYAPAQIVRDAREHGVEVRGLDVNASDWDNKLEHRRRRMAQRSRYQPAPRFPPDRRVSAKPGRMPSLVAARAATAAFAACRSTSPGAPACRHARCACSPMPMRSGRWGMTGARRVGGAAHSRRRAAAVRRRRARELGEEPDARLPRCRWANMSRPIIRRSAFR